MSRWKPVSGMSIVPPSTPIVALRLMSLSSGTAYWSDLTVVSMTVRTPPPSPDGRPRIALGAVAWLAGAVASPQDVEKSETAASAIAVERVRSRFIYGRRLREKRPSGSDREKH